MITFLDRKLRLLGVIGFHRFLIYMGIIDVALYVDRLGSYLFHMSHLLFGILGFLSLYCYWLRIQLLSLEKQLIQLRRFVKPHTINEEHQLTTSESCIEENYF